MVQQWRGGEWSLWAVVQIADPLLVELIRVQRLAVSLNISNPLRRDRFKLSKWKFSNGHFQLDPTTFLLSLSLNKNVKGKMFRHQVCWLGKFSFWTIAKFKLMQNWWRDLTTAKGEGGGGGEGGNVDQVGRMERKLPADWPAGVRHCSSVQLCAIVCNAQAALCNGCVVCLRVKTAKGFGGTYEGLEVGQGMQTGGNIIECSKMSCRW